MVCRLRQFSEIVSCSLYILTCPLTPISAKRSRDSLRQAFGDVQQLRTLVQGAQDATAAQIQYWSQTLNDHTMLEIASHNHLEDPIFKWTAKNVLAQWKTVLEKHSECSVMVRCFLNAAGKNG